MPRSMSTCRDACMTDFELYNSDNKTYPHNSYSFLNVYNCILMRYETFKGAHAREVYVFFQGAFATSFYFYLFD